MIPMCVYHVIQICSYKYLYRHVMPAMLFIESSDNLISYYHYDKYMCIYTLIYIYIYIYIYIHLPSMFCSNSNSSSSSSSSGGISSSSI